MVANVARLPGEIVREQTPTRYDRISILKRENEWINKKNKQKLRWLCVCVSDYEFWIWCNDTLPSPSPVLSLVAHSFHANTFVSGSGWAERIIIKFDCACFRQVSSTYWVHEIHSIRFPCRNAVHGILQRSHLGALIKLHGRRSSKIKNCECLKLQSSKTAVASSISRSIQTHRIEFSFSFVFLFI